MAWSFTSSSKLQESKRFHRKDTIVLINKMTSRTRDVSGSKRVFFINEMNTSTCAHAHGSFIHSQAMKCRNVFFILLNQFAFIVLDSYDLKNATVVK